MTETKKCTKCGVEKALTEFYKRVRYASGYESDCKTCGRARALAWQKENMAKAYGKTQDWRRENPGREYSIGQRRRVLKYGLSLGDRAELLRLQSCLCVICRARLTPGTTGHALDHDHQTGKFRGIICPPCNKVLGFSKDNPAVLREAAAYLERHKKA